MSKFAKELEELINRHSLENESNTPDFILANYMMNCLGAGTTLINQREHWYGKALTIGGVVELRPQSEQ